MTIIELPPETVREVIFTCVVLHNILRSQYQGQNCGQQPGDDSHLQNKSNKQTDKPNDKHKSHKHTNPLTNISPTSRQTDKPNDKHKSNKQTNPMTNISPTNRQTEKPHKHNLLNITNIAYNVKATANL